MPTLLLRFPAGRYHATPWGHHVNEGLIEWPPSPWRLLRALLATGYNTLHWPAEGPPPHARSMLLKLANTLPSYRLPSASGAHSRHYMPLTVLDKGREKTTLVFDTWANIEDGALAVSWDARLEHEEREVLSRLAERMNYLGRSESWVEAELLPEDASPTQGISCIPCGDTSHPGPGWEQVPVMALQTESAYAEWRREAVKKALADLPTVDTSKKKLTAADRKLLKQRTDAEAPFPNDLLTCLQVNTNWLREHGWNQPPGTRKEFYWRRIGTLEANAPALKMRSRSASVVQAMLLSMSTDSGNMHALPSVTRTLPQAELLHTALVATSQRISGTPSLILRGCDENRKPLSGPHRHAHILPLDLDGDGHLDHTLVWAPMGLDSAAQQAVRRIRRTFTKGGTGPLRLSMVATGSIETLSELSGIHGEIFRRVTAGHGATEWISLTPFVAPRHAKARGRNTLQGQVQAELESRQLPAALHIEFLDLRDDPRLMSFRHYVSFRRKGPQPPARHIHAIRIQFESPVVGPLCLGYGAHFGLGMMMANNP